MAENLPPLVPSPLPAEPVPVLPYATPPSLAGLEVYREGRTVVLRKGAPLPPFCVKCNQPATVHHPQRYYWHHPGLYLIFLGCILNWLLTILIYVILALVLRQKAEVQIPLCDAHDQRRRRMRTAGVGLMLAGIVSLGLAIYLGIAMNHRDYAAAIIGGFVALVAGGILHTYGMPLRARRITVTHAYLQGACPEYLNQLPGTS